MQASSHFADGDGSTAGRGGVAPRLGGTRFARRAVPSPEVTRRVGGGSGLAALLRRARPAPCLFRCAVLPSSPSFDGVRARVPPFGSPAARLADTRIESTSPPPALIVKVSVGGNVPYGGSASNGGGGPRRGAGSRGAHTAARRFIATGSPGGALHPFVAAPPPRAGRVARRGAALRVTGGARPGALRLTSPAALARAVRSRGAAPVRAFPLPPAGKSPSAVAAAAAAAAAAAEDAVASAHVPSPASEYYINRYNVNISS
ncbi:Protein of unknown function [Gryllus bimaculatus]|nr:Protein of unknown function [Gryllus bimaculatus]